MAAEATHPIPEAGGKVPTFAAEYAPADEALVPRLLQETAHALDEESRVGARAKRYVEAIREAHGGIGGLEDFMHDYSLSTKEGLALMSLAEALLRVPDAATQDRLIEDKLASGDWAHAAARESESLLVSATTWALGMTVRIVHPGETPEGIIGRLGQRLGMPTVQDRGAPGDAYSRPPVRARRDDRGRAVARQSGAAQELSPFLRHAGGRRPHCRRREALFRILPDAIEAIGKSADGALAGRSRHLGQAVGASPALCRAAARARAERAGSAADRALPRRQGARPEPDRRCGGGRPAGTFARGVRALLREPGLAGWDGLGLAVQAYQKRAPAVIDWLGEASVASGRRLMVRLVKGAYWDTEIKRAQERGLPDFPVFSRKPATDVCYLACAKRLLAARPRLYPQFATHNAITAAALIEMAGDEAEQGFEFQRLHGMSEALYAMMHEREGFDCRIYAPVGSHKELLAYLVRRLLENGANSSFVNAVNDHDVPIESLLVPPAESLAGRSPRHAGDRDAGKSLRRAQEFARRGVRKPRRP